MNATAPKPADDVVLAALKTGYFAMCREEKIGSTPELTAKIDTLEKEIRARQSQPSTSFAQ